MKRIDIEEWSRRDQYRYFSKMQCPYCSVTCEIDVSAARSFMKDCGIPSYVGMIYLVTKAANSVPELRLRIEGEAVYDYDVVHPSFTILSDGGQLYFCRARYTDDPGAFIKHTREVMAQTKSAGECPLDSTGQDVLYLSCLPWVHFTSVSHPMNLSSPDAIPRIVWGRFEAKENRIVMAVSLQVHHGLADGLHISQFMQALGESCAAPDAGFSGLNLSS